jgi:hypothetical protein
MREYDHVKSQARHITRVLLSSSLRIHVAESTFPTSDAGNSEAEKERASLFMRECERAFDVGTRIGLGLLFLLFVVLLTSLLY